MDIPSAPPLGNPTASTSLTATSESFPVIIEHNDEAPAERTFTLSTVISFVFAASVAHFALVNGGFTGEKGYDKWEAVQRWVQGVFYPGSG